MTVEISLRIPEESLISLKEQPESFARELRMLAAVKLYELGTLFSERAAQLASVTRMEYTEFKQQLEASALGDEFGCELEMDAMRWDDLIAEKQHWLQQLRLAKELLQ